MTLREGMAWFAIVVTIGTGFGFSYVTRERTDATVVRVDKLEASIEIKSTDALASAAGTALVGRLIAIEKEQLLQREMLTEILRLVR